MADTIINTPGAQGDSASAVGWVAALIIVLALIVGAFVWYRNGAVPNVPSTGDINVTIPSTGGGAAQ